MIGMSKKLLWLVSVLVCLLGLTGCERALLSGTVETVHGEALPGVAVHVVEGTGNAQTDARGKYSIFQPFGDIRLHFAKSGYAPAEITVEVNAAQQLALPTVEMWQIPPGAGVYLFDEGRIIEASRVTPRNFLLADGSTAYGSQRAAEAFTESAEPFIVCYKTPRYDARLSRLHVAEAKLNVSDTYNFDVWTAAGTLRADLHAVDPAEELLLKLTLDRALDPGVYAVHWGALEGSMAVEDRIYLFEVLEPSPAISEGVKLGLVAEGSVEETSSDEASHPVDATMLE